MKLIVILTLFVVGTHQQEIKCARTYFSERVECTFINLKTVDEMMNVAKNESTAYRSNTIKFENSKIQSFPNKTFGSFYSVANLDASSIGLEEINDGTFPGRKWNSIVLSKNQLKKLSGKMFANMALTLLDLSENQIEVIGDDVFSGAEISILKLSNNKISSTSFVSTFTFYNHLELDSNDIQDIGTIMESPKNWKKLTSSFVVSAPKLVLAKNKLRKFNCNSDFQFSVVSLSENLDLTEVNLNDCNIANLNVASCGNLKTIKMNERLENLDAEHNNLKNIDFTNAKNLTQLDLANNSLTIESIYEVLQMEKLLALDLSRNHIGELNVSTFHKLNSLISLKLQATGISNIEFGTFSHQHNVKLLDVSDNNLMTLDINMFMSMNSLLSLDIGGNQLVKIDNIEGQMFTLPMLKIVDISVNNWSCSYLMLLIKRFQILGIALQVSKTITHDTNIKGIGCTQDSSNPVKIDLIPINGSVTNDQFNDVVSKFNAETTNSAQFQQNIENRLASLERTLKGNTNPSAISSALKYETTSIEVKNSRLMDITYIVAALFFIVFIALKIVQFVKVSQITRRPARTVSENPLSATFEQF
ncbi:unnamed protein product [Diamesa serratosioi]